MHYTRFSPFHSHWIPERGGAKGGFRVFSRPRVQFSMVRLQVHNYSQPSGNSTAVSHTLATVQVACLDVVRRQGLGKGGAKRHRKVLRDNIQGNLKPPSVAWLVVVV